MTDMCTYWTNKFNNVSDAMDSILTTGASYTIAGRKYESHEIGELEKLQGKYFRQMNRYCNGNCGIIMDHPVPTDL